MMDPYFEMVYEAGIAYAGILGVPGLNVVWRATVEDSVKRWAAQQPELLADRWAMLPMTHETVRLWQSAIAKVLVRGVTSGEVYSVNYRWQADEAPPRCSYCGERPRTRVNEYTAPTCGASECQQADYQANRERNATRRRRRKSS